MGPASGSRVGPVRLGKPGNAGARGAQVWEGIAALLGNRPALMTTKRPAFPGSGVLARQVLVLSVQCNVMRIEEDDTRVSCVP